jgi:hypothetical protein
LSRIPVDGRHLPAMSLTAIATMGHQVVVRTNTPGGRRAVASMFRHMCGPARHDVLGSLALEKVKTTWIVSGGADGEAVHDSLPPARAELLERVTRFVMTARSDLIWLHASGVARDGRAVLITGPSGSGKSTLASRLIHRGFDYLGDDVLPFEPLTGMVHPFPVSPSVRTAAPQYLLTSKARLLRKEDVVVSQDRVAAQPVRVAAIVFPRFAPGPSLVHPLSPGRAAIELLQQCRDFEQHREQAVRAMGALAEGVPTWTLTFVDPEQGAEAIASAYSRT